MKCPFHKVRQDLPPLTARIAALPVDDRGYPVPYFVSWIDGKPEFRVADGKKWAECVRSKLCWVCGQPLGKFLAFAIGPMCVVNRTTSEPPTHLDCAEWSVKGCPFLSKPQMVRRVDEKIEAISEQNPSSGLPILRNPGATCIWTTTSYKVFPDGMGGRLIRLGEPHSVSWWREGRTATRAEILESIETGLPKLREVCHSKEDLDALQKHVSSAMKLLPK